MGDLIRIISRYQLRRKQEQCRHRLRDQSISETSEWKPAGNGHDYLRHGKWKCSACGMEGEFFDRGMYCLDLKRVITTYRMRY